MTCRTLSCNNNCIDPDTCISGCVCPNGFVENPNGDCVVSSNCYCTYNGVNYSNGAIIEDVKNCKKW